MRQPGKEYNVDPFDSGAPVPIEIPPIPTDMINDV